MDETRVLSPVVAGEVGWGQGQGVSSMDRGQAVGSTDSSAVVAQRPEAAGTAGTTGKHSLTTSNRGCPAPAWDLGVLLDPLWAPRLAPCRPSPRSHPLVGTGPGHQAWVQGPEEGVRW